jgi:subtilisin family serine protease
MLNRFKRLNLKGILVGLILVILCLLGALYFSGVFTGKKQAANKETNSTVSSVENSSEESGSEESSSVIEPEIKDINEKLAQIDINNATLEDVIKTFGSPKTYMWGDETFTKDNLPQTYVAFIERGFSVLIDNNMIGEIRFQCDEEVEDYTGYIYKDTVKIGSPMEDALEVLDTPEKVVSGEPCSYEEGVLYKDIDGVEGSGYYCLIKQGVRMFFDQGKVAAIYLMRTQAITTTNNMSNASTLLSPENTLEIVKHQPIADWSFLRNEKLDSLPVHEESESDYEIDLRQKDISNLNLADRLNELKHSFYDTDTKWPEKLPENFDPKKIMETGMNQGLGIRQLQLKGITGKGINIGMIDQALLVDHQEYIDRVKLYEEIHCFDEAASMHGPGMASLAVGKNLGVAPEADLYFIGMTNMNPLGNNQMEIDFTPVAQAVDRMLEINEMLPQEDKLRVISISASFCPDNKGYHELTAAIERAKEAGIFVISCNLFETYNHEFWYQGLDRDPLADPEETTSYNVIPWKNWISQIKHIDGTDIYYEKELNKYQPEEILLVPMASKTMASPTGLDDYSFTRVGGWSCVEPYLTGLYAMACQVKPDITAEIFLSQAMETGDKIEYTDNNKKYTGKMINPVKLMESLEKVK